MASNIQRYTLDTAQWFARVVENYPTRVDQPLGETSMGASSALFTSCY
jgi:hypothetical protein